MRQKFYFVLAGFITLLMFAVFSSSVGAADAPPRAAATKTSYQPGPMKPAVDAAPLVLSAAPRETRAQGIERFAPLASYLSKELGRKVEYRHAGSWGVYRAQMVRGDYDIVFDGPHLTGWRVQHMDYHVLARVAGGFEFALIVRRDNARASKLAQLAGRTLCAHAPPNFSAEVALALFDNPVRQPALLPTDGWENIYRSVESGRCVAGIIPVSDLAARDPDGVVMRTLYRSPAYPNQAISAGPRLSQVEQEWLARVLASPEAGEALRALSVHYGMQQPFVAASDGEYQGLARFLQNEWGFDTARR